MSIIVLNDKKYKDAKNLSLLEITFLQKEINILNYQAIIFTSKNGVLAIDKISEKWKNLEIYSIGEATTKAIESLNAKVTYTAKSSYGDDFAQELVEKLKSKKSLYIRAKKIVSNLRAILEQNSIDISEEILYQTSCKRVALNQQLEKHSIIIFSSPSTIECFFKNFEWEESYKAIVIGTKTAKYMPKEIKYKVSDKQDINYCIELGKKIIWSLKSCKKL